MSKMNFAYMMRQAGFPESVIDKMKQLEQLFMEKGKTEECKRDAEELTNPAVKEQFAEKLDAVTLKWGNELGVNRRTLELYILLKCWEIVKVRYDEQGISEEIFMRTFHDMYCKWKECLDVYGVDGIFVGFWYDGFFDLTRFALGRLQYELIPYEEETPYVLNGKEIKKGDLVINMHIPSEGPLTEDSIEDSLRQARDFFPGYDVFVMDSWLLDPDLMKCLPDGNIRKFTSRFDIVRVEKKDKFEDGWRVFGKEWEKAPEDLPARTRLQKPIAEYLKNGGKLGEGFGILVR